MASIERKYVLTKVGKGDYLLPSNDGKQLYRIKTYLDRDLDATSRYQVDVFKDYWGAWKWLGPMEGVIDTTDEAWDRWQMVSSENATRKDAIQDALRLR